MSAGETQARCWTYRRQRLNRVGSDAATVLRDIVAVYSVHPTAPLSLLARCEPFGADVYRSLDALRLPAMRGSIHLLPRETAHLAFRAVAGGADDGAGQLEYFGVSAEEYARLREQVIDAASVPRTARELRAVTRAPTTLAPVLNAMTRSGDLLRVGTEGLRSNDLLYVAASIPEADADEALTWLAHEYLRAFGPARPADFAWWAGVPPARADAAISGLDTRDVDGGLLLRAADVEAFEQASPLRDTVDLLPKWDCYTMGYPAGGRGRFADLDVADQFYDADGNSLPTVLIDGVAAGTWSARRGAPLEIEVDLFESPGPSVRRELDARAAAIRDLLA